MGKKEDIVVLVVEDDPADQKLVKNALANQDIISQIHVAQTGEEAMEYLHQSRNGNPQNPMPDVILLDLNMPGMGGREFLKQIKADFDLCSTPVVILTTSDSEVDVEQCYRLQAAGYIQKPTSPGQFKESLRKFVKYWFVSSSLVKN